MIISQVIRPNSSISSAALFQSYIQVRNRTLSLVQNLNEEYAAMQSMPDASPIKWHLAHSTWFFETFILKRFKTDYQTFDPDYDFLFNSYYNSINQNRLARDKRGSISKPNLEEVINYRNYVDNYIEELIEEDLLRFRPNIISEIFKALILGINHEQQHQELILTDIKHALFKQPLKPIFSEYSHKAIMQSKVLPAKKSEYLYNEGCLVEIGYQNTEAWNDFAYDNEGPRHKTYLEPYLISSQLITNNEYQEFMEDNAYSRPELWLSDGFDFIRANNINSPLYWFKEDNQWQIFTLGGSFKLNPNEPVCHISFYEAEAFARWSNARLLRETEWEHYAETQFNKKNLEESNFQEENIFHPVTNSSKIFGNLWQWTQSSYSPYPNSKELTGAFGEYNGKFMINQMVLKGGSCASPRAHFRTSYRNFFYPTQRWQFMGIRLAKDIN